MRALFRQWQHAFRLDSWQYEWRFKDLADDEDGSNTLAEVDHDGLKQMATFTLHSCLRPEYYEWSIVHEWLHVLWFPVERAIHLLSEPAQSVVFDAHHLAINRTAAALVGKPRRHPWGHEMLLKRPPWDR